MICNAGADFWILFHQFGSSMTQIWAKIDCRSNFRCVVTVYAQHIFQYDHFRCWVRAKNSQNKNTLSDFILPLQMHVQNHERVQNFCFYPFRKNLKGPYANHILIPQGSTGSSTFFDIKWKPIFFWLQIQNFSFKFFVVLEIWQKMWN